MKKLYMAIQGTHSIPNQNKHFQCTGTSIKVETFLKTLASNFYSEF